MNLGKATAYIDLDSSKFKKGMSDVQSSIKSMADKFGESNNSMIKGVGDFLNNFDNMPKAFKGIGPLAMAMGTTVTGAFKLGAAGAKEFIGDAKLVGGVFVDIGNLAVKGLGMAMKEGVAFEQTMYQVKAITGASNEDFLTLTNTARDWGSKTRYSANEVASAMTYLGMAGWETTEIMDGMSGVLNLATVGNTDLALSADILSDGLTAMSMSAKEANDFADMMSATITNSNTSVSLMGETMKYVGPVAGALGIEMEDLSVAIGLAGNAGIKGSSAGTALRAGLTNLVKPTKKMQEAMEKYGIAIQTTSDGSVDFQGTIGHLRDKLGSLDATTQAQTVATIFGKEAMSAWLSIINASQSDVNNLTNTVNESTQSMRYWASEIYGSSDYIKEYEKSLKSAGLSQEEISEKMEKASTSSEGFKDALLEMGYSMEEADAATSELKVNLDALDKLYEDNLLTARALNLSTNDLSLAITMLGADSSVTQSDMEGLMNSVKDLNSVEKQGDIAVRNLAKGNQELSSYLKENNIAIKDLDYSSLNLTQKLDVLKIATKGMTDEQKAQTLATLGLEGEHLQLMEILGLSDEAYNEYKENLKETKGLTEKLAETMDEATMGSIKSMGSAISDTLIEAFNMAKPHIVDFTNIIGESARILKEDGLAEAINYMVDETRNKLSNLPQVATETMSYFLSAIQDTFPNVLSLGGDIILSLAQGIINNEDQIASTVSTIVGNVANWVTNNFGTIIQAGNSIIDAIQQGMQENQSAISQAVDTFITGTTNYFLNKKTSFLTLGIDVAGSIVTGAVQGLNEKIGEWTQGISDFFLRPFDTFGGQLADEALKNGKMIADKSGEGLDTNQMNFAEKFSAFMKHGLNWKEDYATQAQQAGTGTADNVAQGLESRKPTVGSASSRTFEQVLVEATGKLDQLSPETAGALNEVCNEILNSASKMYNGAKTSFSMLGKASKEAMSDMFTGIRGSMQQTQQMVQQISTQTYLQASKSWVSLATASKQAMSDLYRGVSTSATMTERNVLQSFTNIYNNGSKSLEGASNRGKSAMSDLYNGATNSSNKMANKVISDWNRIKSALGTKITGTVEIKAVGVQAALNQINSIKNATKIRSLQDMSSPVQAFTFERSSNDTNIMKAYDMVRSNDIASYVGGSIVGVKSKELKINVEATKSRREKEAKVIEVNLNIENFNNNNNKFDIDQIGNELAQVIKRKAFG